MGAHRARGPDAGGGVRGGSHARGNTAARTPARGGRQRRGCASRRGSERQVVRDPALCARPCTINRRPTRSSMVLFNIGMALFKTTTLWRT